MALACGAKRFTVNALVRLRCGLKDAANIQTKLAPDEANYHYTSQTGGSVDPDEQHRTAAALTTLHRRLGPKNRADLADTPSTLSATGALRPAHQLIRVEPEMWAACPEPLASRLHPILFEDVAVSRACRTFALGRWVEEAAERAAAGKSDEAEREALYRHLLAPGTKLTSRLVGIIRRSPVMRDDQGVWARPEELAVLPAKDALILGGVVRAPAAEWRQRSDLLERLAVRRKVFGDDLVALAGTARAAPQLANSVEDALRRHLPLLTSKVVLALRDITFLRARSGSLASPARLHIPTAINVGCLSAAELLLEDKPLYRRLGCPAQPTSDVLLRSIDEAREAGRPPPSPQQLYPALVEALREERSGVAALVQRKILYVKDRFVSPHEALVAQRPPRCLEMALPVIRPGNAIADAYAALGADALPKTHHWTAFFGWIDARLRATKGKVPPLEKAFLREAYRVRGSFGLPKCLLTSVASASSRWTGITTTLSRKQTSRTMSTSRASRSPKASCRRCILRHHLLRRHHLRAPGLRPNLPRPWRHRPILTRARHRLSHPSIRSRSRSSTPPVSRHKRRSARPAVLGGLTPIGPLARPPRSSATGTHVDVHPLRGLVNFGPYSKGSFGGYTSRVRIATVGPTGSFKRRGELMLSLRDTHRPSDRHEYVPEYPGFETLFKVALESAPRDAHIKWQDDLHQLPGEGDPQARLFVAMEAALRRLDAVRNDFDVVLVHFPDSWNPATRGKFFDAHDALKALGAKYNIPTQVLNDRAFTFSHKASLAWRLATALYVKAAGTPWKLAPLKGVPVDTAYIGLAYALRGDQQDAHYVTCCSQVFDMDGGGMQFVAFEASDPVADVAEARRNPFLSRDDMRAVLARSLELYQGRNGGNLPKRMVIHKTTAFKEGEIDGAFDALAGVPEIECVEVSAASCWRGVWLIKSGQARPPTRPSNYPVPRGTMVVRSGNSALVWVAGNAPEVSTTGDYYQGKKSIPRPLQLVRHAGRGPLEITAFEALALTKMDWNNDALYDPVPVSIRYSQRLARTIANVPDLPRNVYPYRLFM